MSMHYIAQREEHAEQAFLATAKLHADGTRVPFSREDHDSLHLFDRADRFLPHGWCLLPPPQTCDKGNACLTCSVFVTDATHRTALERQLAETEQLIARTTAAFEQRHGRPMPDDNVWLAQRRAEHAALTRLLATHGRQPRPRGAGRRLRRRPGGPGPDCPRHQPRAKDPAVTDDRARRIAVLNAAAKAKSQTKTSAAEQAIRTLVKRGEPVTFQAVCREAGVSHAFLYGNHDLRAASSTCVTKLAPRRSRAPTAPDTVVLALTSQIDQLKKRHRDEVQALRTALEQAHGENLQLRRELARRGAPPGARAD